MAHESNNKRGCLLASVAIAAFILLLFGYWSGGAYTEVFPRPFNPVGWKKAEISDKSRCGMVADLKWRIGLEGKTRNEIAQLLGPSDGQPADKDIRGWLLCPSFMDIWILEVRWSDDRVISAWVRDT